MNDFPPDRLAMRPREAARSLGISQRTLFTWTRAGLVPHVRVGGVVLFPVDVLRQWLAEQTKKEGGTEPPRSKHEPL